MITVKRHDKVIQTKLNKYKTEGGSLLSKSDAVTDTFDPYKDTETVSAMSKPSTRSDLEKHKAQISIDCVDNIHDSLNSLPLSTNDFSGQGRANQDVKNDSHDVNIHDRCLNEDILDDNIRANMPDLDKPRGSKACHTKDSRRSRTVTIIMFTVTVTCMVIYIPYLILATLRAVVTEYECMLSREERVIYKIFIRSYFMKAIINPLVYGIFDPRFRGALANILTGNKRCGQN